MAASYMHIFSQKAALATHDAEFDATATISRADRCCRRELNAMPKRQDDDDGSLHVTATRSYTRPRQQMLR